MDPTPAPEQRIVRISDRSKFDSEDCAFAPYVHNIAGQIVHATLFEVRLRRDGFEHAARSRVRSWGPLSGTHAAEPPWFRFAVTYSSRVSVIRI